MFSLMLPITFHMTVLQETFLSKLRAHSSVSSYSNEEVAALSNSLTRDVTLRQAMVEQAHTDIKQGFIAAG
jgi:hypothetical protein